MFLSFFRSFGAPGPFPGPSPGPDTEFPVKNALFECELQNYDAVHRFCWVCFLLIWESFFMILDVVYFGDAVEEALEAHLGGLRGAMLGCV